MGKLANMNSEQNSDKLIINKKVFQVALLTNKPCRICNNYLEVNCATLAIL